MNIKEIHDDRSNKVLFAEVNKLSHRINITLKQSYYSTVSRVRLEYPKYEPFKNYESFKTCYYR